MKNVEEMLNKKSFRLPGKCRTPFLSEFNSEQDTKTELKADGVQWYQ